MANGNLVFADTSALLALLDGDDQNHSDALKEWKKFAESDAKLFMIDYVRLESCSLIQWRLGAAAFFDFRDAFLPLIKIVAVGEQGFELDF